MDTTEINLYREGVNKLLELKINQEISNGFPEHAAILFEQFFKHSQKHVRIFCKNLSASVFDMPHVIETAANALRRGVQIEVLIQDEQPEAQGFRYLAESHPGLALFKCKDDSFKHVGYNFTVMDDRAYRFESDRKSIKAIANMFDQKIAFALIRSFETMQQAPVEKLAGVGAGHG